MAPSTLAPSLLQRGALVYDDPSGQGCACRIEAWTRESIVGDVRRLCSPLNHNYHTTLLDDLEHASLQGAG